MRKQEHSLPLSVCATMSLGKESKNAERSEEVNAILEMRPEERRFWG